jgi:hypothetical protein
MSHSPLRLDLDAARLLAVFKRALRAAVPAASLLVAPGCPACPPEDEIFLVREPDERLQALLAACRDPEHPVCGPLCEAVSGLPAGSLEHCELHQERDGYFEVHVGSNGSCLGGRRPQRLVFGGARRARSAVGAWFARLCQLEAASVPAFQTLEKELGEAGAPPVLARAAAAAARDERRHTRLAARLARRFGAEPGRPHVAPTPARGLAALAEENAVEGCVREAYGAALAFVQATTSTDPLVRAGMGAIAADETRHAALAWAVHAWVEPRLGAMARRRVRQARAAAVAQLRVEVRGDWTAALGTTAGLPAPPVATALVEQLARTLWA